MIKILFFILTLATIIEARENPFFPAAGEMDIPITSNISTKIPPLKQATITLPSQARVIQKVTIEYENLDGTVENETIVLNNFIDWHLPIFISQNYTTSKKPEKQKEIKESFKLITSIKYAKFFTLNETLKIVTKDKILRDFLLVQPHRIVIDFDRDTSLKSLVKRFKDNKFSKIRVANHDGYYRVVVELDGYYRYKMKKVSDGYIFRLR